MTFMHTEYSFPFVPRSVSLSSIAKIRLQWMDFIDQGHSIPQCARHFCYPYRTVKYWRDRYNRYNLRSLENKSKRPKRVRQPQISSRHKQLAIRAIKYELPGSGKVTIQKYIQREYGVTIGQSRIQQLINKVRPKRKKIKRPYVKTNRTHMYCVPATVRNQPGGLVYLDVKYLKIAGRKWYQFTAIDHATRILEAKIYRQATAQSTLDFFTHLQQQFPFAAIQYVGTDNGSEFLGVFDNYLQLHDIQHVFSSPSSPKQNPYVERVIRTIIDQHYRIYGLEDTPQLHQKALDQFCYKYNYVRPHHSLNLLTPMQKYATFT